MTQLLRDYALAAKGVLEGVAPESTQFYPSCGGAGIKGQEHGIVLGGCRLDQHVEAHLHCVAVAANVLLGQGNRPLWTQSCHPQSTRGGPSRRDQQIFLIASCLYPGGGGALGRKADKKKYVATNRQELHAIALVGRLSGKWPPYVDPDFGEWV
ncbi:unnamed protein product, partial [Ectocarpus fasciculatus]